MARQRKTRFFIMTPIDLDAVDAALDEIQSGETEERRPGRPKGSKNALKPSETPQAAPPAPPIDEEWESTREALISWPKLIEKKLRPIGLGPDAVMIAVTRIGLGPYPSDAIPIGTFDGATVAGNTDISPGDAINNYICEVFHMGRRGPALYKLRVYFKVKGDTIRQMEVKLDDPNEIAAQRQRMMRYDAQNPMLGATGVGPGSRGYSPQAPVYQAPYVPGASYQPPPPGPQGQSPQEMFGMFQSMMGMVTEFNERARQAAMATGQPPPAPIVVQQAPPTPPPAPVEPPKPRVTPEEERYIREGQFREMAAQLGFVPRDSIPQALPPSSQQVAAMASNPVDSVRAVLSSFKEIDKLRGDFAKVLGISEPGDDDPEPEPEKPPFTLTKIPMANFKGKEILWPGGTEAGFLNWAKAFVASNLEVSREVGLGALQKLSQIVDQTSFGKLLAQLVEKGGAAADVARLGQGIVASGPALPNGVLRKGPSA
jgi:hypothetical protein